MLEQPDAFCVENPPLVPLAEVLMPDKKNEKLSLLQGTSLRSDLSHGELCCHYVLLGVGIFSYKVQGCQPSAAVISINFFPLKNKFHTENVPALLKMCQQAKHLIVFFKLSHSNLKKTYFCSLSLLHTHTLLLSLSHTHTLSLSCPLLPPSHHRKWDASLKNNVNIKCCF